MDNALLVRGVKRFADLSRDRQRLVDRDGTVRDAFTERRSFNELEYQRRRVAGILDAVDAADVLVIDRGKHLRLATKAREAFGIVDEGF